MRSERPAGADSDPVADPGRASGPAGAASDSVAGPSQASGTAGLGGEPLDPSWLERARNRDPEALAVLFDRFFDPVYRIVYRLLGDRLAAEDLTQEVFYKVYRAIHLLDPTRDPRPWIVAIAYNACRDLWRSSAYRASRRSAPVQESDPPVQLVSSNRNPEEALVRSERERLVQEAITRLPESLRVAIVLHDYQGMSHEEVATVMRINHAAARKRYSRALAALGKMLREKLR